MCHSYWKNNPEINTFTLFRYYLKIPYINVIIIFWVDTDVHKLSPRIKV